MYVIQSSNLASIGINPSLFTDNVGEFNFFKGKKKALHFKSQKVASNAAHVLQYNREQIKIIWIEFSLFLMSFNGALHELANIIHCTVTLK